MIGGGCGAVTAAFELTRPEHRGKYHVTVYQLGWRLGGKGASGRGPADRIEEHGLHMWLGFYENAFRLLRECYAELNRDPMQCPIADWRDAFYPDPYVGMADIGNDAGWLSWLAFFPPGEGLPGDPLTSHNPFSVGSYLTRTVALLRTLLLGVRTRRHPSSDHEHIDATSTRATADDDGDSASSVIGRIARLMKYGLLTTTAGLIEAVALLEVVLRSLPRYPESTVLSFMEQIASSARRQFEDLIESDDEVRYKWEIIDLVLAIIVGLIRSRVIYDRRGLDALNEYECRDWLRMNGASQRSLDSAFVRGLYDLALAYEDGDVRRPGIAAGQALRGAARMFFTYRGQLFWKMRAGMGDVVFAPFYEVLERRGVTFEFFHRLENVRIADPEAPGQRPYVSALEFDVQAEVVGGAKYQPLKDVRGLPCWPSEPDFHQLVDGERLKSEGVDFESHWDRRKVATKTLAVTQDFDFVVLGVGMGAIPHVCGDIVARDPRWQAMVEHVKTVASQAFQIWMREDMRELGWLDPPVNLSSFVKPFDTWADMSELIAYENWPTPPKSLAYFCSVLADPDTAPSCDDASYSELRRQEVKRNAIRFLNHDIQHLWSNASRSPGVFRWELLIDPLGSRPGDVSDGDPSSIDESRFDTQYWTANVNPSDRYVLALPGSIKYRISPLDNSYDNLTIAGDWTSCGFNEGCVEAAVMSGRLAAHAVSHSPPLEDIIGYDHL